MPTGQMNSSQLDSGQMELMPAGNGLATLQVISHPRLPSGLNPVSSAVMLDRVVAIDSAGSVFLSRDAAKHWEPVPVQWTGKAIAVQAPPRPLHPFSRAVNQETILHTTSAVTPATGASGPALPPASASAEPPPPATASEGQSREAASDKIAPPAPGPSPPAQASAGPTMPGMLFRLSNDRHETWVSADGRIWRPQSPAH
jgi:hypothetical protein